MKKLWIIFWVVGLSACQSLNQLQTFRQCQFAWQSMENISLAGINFAGMNSLTQLGMLDIAKITTAYAQGSLPLSLTAQIGVTNPNPTKAALTKLDWVMEFDGKQIVEGTVNDRVEVEPNGGKTVMPLKVMMDLKKIMQDRSQTELLDMTMELSKNAEKSKRVNFKVRPYFSIAGVLVPAPAYFDVIR